MYAMLYSNKSFTVVKLYFTFLFSHHKFLSQISTEGNQNNSISCQGSLRNRSHCQSVMNKKSALIFPALLMLHCCNAGWLLVETEDQEIEEDKKSEEDSVEGNMLPDDLQLIDDSFELNSPGAGDSISKENKKVPDWIFNVG